MTRPAHADPRPAGGQPALRTSPLAAEPTARSACQPVSEHKFGLSIAPRCPAWRTSRKAPCLPRRSTRRRLTPISPPGVSAARLRSTDSSCTAVSAPLPIRSWRRASKASARSPTAPATGAPALSGIPASRAPIRPCAAGITSPGRDFGQPGQLAAKNVMPGVGTSDAAASEGSPVGASAHLTTTDHAPGQFWLGRPLPRRGWPSRCASPHARRCARIGGCPP